MAKRILQTKICILGDSAVGKTSLIRRFVFDLFDDRYIATMGTKVSKKKLSLSIEKKEGLEPKWARDNEVSEMIDKRIDVELTLLIWDIVGQEEYHELRELYYKGASGALVVCDVTREKTIENTVEWVNSFYDTVGKKPVLFVANKYDLVKDKLDIEIEKLIEKLSFGKQIYTSAKTGENVELAFSTLSKMVLSDVDRKEY
ncbi:MAG: Rab family GTPase [Candidatus Thermoplasmatota archaeon]